MDQGAIAEILGPALMDSRMGTRSRALASIDPGSGMRDPSIGIGVLGLASTNPTIGIVRTRA